MSTTPKLDRITVSELAALYEAKGSGLASSLLKQTQVRLGALMTAPLVFQPRNMEDRRWTKRQHIEILAKALKEAGKLDHIDVFAIDGVRIVVDGHCRLEAYRLAEFKDNDRVPVRHLQGSFADALKASAATNSKDKLALTKDDKAEAAWRMVRYSEHRKCYTYREIKDAAGVSVGTVGNMANVLTATLDFDPREYTWREVKRKQRGEVEYDEQWQEKQTRAFAERLRKIFGEKPNLQPELFLNAIEYAYPRVHSQILEWVARERRDELDELDERLRADEATSADDF
jgi:hypothetical protein